MCDVAARRQLWRRGAVEQVAENSERAEANEAAAHGPRPPIARVNDLPSYSGRASTATLFLSALLHRAGLFYQFLALQPAGIFYPTAPMIDHAALRKRIRRLEELSLGLARDEELFRGCSCQLLADEREKYREGLRQAIAGGQRQLAENLSRSSFMVIRFKAVTLATFNGQVKDLIRHGLDGAADYNRL